MYTADHVPATVIIRRGTPSNTYAEAIGFVVTDGKKKI
jgi:hypothetical protein